MSLLYLAPYMVPELHLSHQQIAQLASALAVTWALSSLMLGAVSDRYGRRIVLVPAIFLFSGLSWMSGFAHSFTHLLVIRALMGLAEGSCWSTINAILEESSHPSRRGRNVGFVVSAAALVGLAVAPVLTTQVAARYGWRYAFFVAAIPGIVSGALVWAFVREPARHADSDADRPSSLANYASILRSRNVWLCCLAATGFMSWLYVQNVFAPLYITEVEHQAATTAGFLLGATGLGSFVFGFTLPWVSDHIGRRRALLIMAALSTVVPTILLVPSLYQHLWLLAAILFLTNGGEAMAALIIVLLPTESVPAGLAATAIGFVTMTGELIGATLMPSIGASLADRYGQAMPLWLAAAGTGLVFLAALGMNERDLRE
jgi:predicted MFS family arabinose efflux permease